MLHNMNAGRMRDYIEIIDKDGSVNEFGEPTGEALVFDGFGEIKSTSGRQRSEMGAALSDEVITVLMWYDHRITRAYVLRTTSGDYEIKGIQPDDGLRGMIVTAQVISSSGTTLPERESLS